jgi:ATP-binding cassette subfamily B protein
MLKRFISYYKPHKKLLALDMLASLLISLIGMTYPIVTNKMLNVYIPQKMYGTIVVSGIIVLCLYFIRMLMRYFVQYYGHLIGVKMQSRMRQDLFTHLEKLPFSFYDNHETGRIMTRITSDLFEVCELAHHGPENLLISSVMIMFRLSAKGTHGVMKQVLPLDYRFRYTVSVGLSILQNPWR